MGARRRNPERDVREGSYNSFVRRGEVREWLKRSASKADIP
jgi:hypothetical protein